MTIKVKLNNLIITKCGEDIWIPLDDISMIVLDNLASNLSTRLMCQLAEQGIGLMLCNQQHLPTGFTLNAILILQHTKKGAPIGAPDFGIKPCFSRSK